MVGASEESLLEYMCRGAHLFFCLENNMCTLPMAIACHSNICHVGQQLSARNECQIGLLTARI